LLCKKNDGADLFAINLLKDEKLYVNHGDNNFLENTVVKKIMQQSAFWDGLNIYSSEDENEVAEKDFKEKIESWTEH
jgi:hypothetical protein